MQQQQLISWIWTENRSLDVLLLPQAKYRIAHPKFIVQYNMILDGWFQSCMDVLEGCFIGVFFLWPHLHYSISQCLRLLFSMCSFFGLDFYCWLDVLDAQVWEEWCDAYQAHPSTADRKLSSVMALDNWQLAIGNFCYHDPSWIDLIVVRYDMIWNEMKWYEFYNNYTDTIYLDTFLFYI